MAKRNPEFYVHPLSVSNGDALPLGCVHKCEGINFSIFSEHATRVTLVLFKSGEHAPIARIELCPKRNKTGSVWHIMIKGLDPGRLRYGYMMDMQPNPDPNVFRFDPEKIVLDPHAKALSGASTWGAMHSRQGEAEKKHLTIRNRRGVIDEIPFDWEDDRQLCTPMNETVIYELHVRGYTQHASSNVRQKGTYLGLCEKIPYLKELGITAVELLPVYEFEETDTDRFDPETGEALLNFWGYHPISFFSPKASYASDGRNGRQTREFREMVREFHKAGIEVILDVVFNHTAEGNEKGHTFNFRGIDNPIYYMIDPQSGEYLNYSGCGNTVNCNQPVVRDMIIDALHYWVMEMHVDGFRFDLASILGRGQNGEVLSSPPLLERIAHDPILSKTKLIAEAWDAAGLYQVGSFPAWGRWSEWNGRFRDDIRSFVKGDPGKVSALAYRLMGSPDIYRESGRAPYHSINFVTSHDGFTLRDLVSYNEKHNWKNGEENRDGDNSNHSWNCGVEGESDDPAIERLRMKQQKNMAFLLLISDGIPMLLAGDEFGRTQQGNNNAYCQDNEIGWVNWDLLEKNRELFRFFRLMIRIRKQYTVLKHSVYLIEGKECRWEDIQFHGVAVGKPDWNDYSRTLGLQIRAVQEGTEKKSGEIIDIYVFLNAHWEAHEVELPEPDGEHSWYRIVDTDRESPCDVLEIPLLLENQKSYRVAERSCIMLEGK